MEAVVDADHRVELLVFCQRIKLAYTRAWALERRGQELSKYRDAVERIELAVKKAATAGLLSRSEELLFQAEAKKARLELSAVATDSKRARAELNKIAGFTVRGALKKPSLSRPPSIDILLGEESNLPAQSRAKLAAALAHEQARQAELDGYPKVSPRLIYERTSDYTDYLGAGISVELPFFNRNQGERLAKGAEARASERSAAYFSGEAYREEVSGLLTSLQSSTDLVMGYESEILPALNRALEAEESLFASGKGSSARLWQVLRALATAQEELLERFVRLYADRIELVTLTGTDF
ncbi:MAG: TolC family protein [Proteobacteria bacterium]|nr:TolC family protein [Pseudomonadota bacterium]